MMDFTSLPRWLDSSATAHYLSTHPGALPRLVKAHRIPAPNYALGPRSPRWDRLALDSALDVGAASTDPDIASQAVVQKILQGRPRCKADASGRRS